MTTFFPLLLLIAIPVIFIMIAVRSSRRQNNPYQANRRLGILCKSQSNRAIAGVCGGIAEHFGWNATVVRLFFLFSGVGILTYIILAIVIPDPPGSPL